MNLFCEHSELYWATLPTSGSMRNGSLYPRQQSVPPTSGNGCSSSPGLPTPGATDWKGSGATQNGRLRGGKPRVPADMDLPEAVSLLPTPTAELNAPAPWKPGVDWWLQSRATRNLEGVVTGNTPLLPTPTSSDERGPVRHPGQPPGSWDRGTDLPEAVGKLLPTPNGGNFNDGEDLQSWEERRQRQLDRHRNGNGFGVPLSMAVQMLPTPHARDWKGSPSDARETFSLPREIAMLPTPQASDALGMGGAASRLNGRQDMLHTLVRREWSEEIPTLPTPQARDWKGSAQTQQRDDRPGRIRGPGDMDLAEAVDLLLPTPNTMDSLPARAADTVKARNRGNGDHGGSPRNLRETVANELPDGGSTSPPSAAGSLCSGGPLPGQLSLLDEMEDFASPPSSSSGCKDYPKGGSRKYPA